MNVLAQVHQLELAAVIAHRSVAAHQLSHSGAVDVTDVAQIEQDVLVSLIQLLAHNIANDIGALAKSEFSDGVHDQDVTYQARTGLNAHNFALDFRYGWG